MRENARGWQLGSFCVRPGRLALVVSLPPAATEEELLAAAAALAPEVDVVEWRIDLFGHSSTPQRLVQLARALRRVAGRPLLATVRSRAEGGRWPDDEQEVQAAILAALIAGRAAELVDIEAALPAAARLTAAAHEAGLLVVLSRHILGAMPSSAELQALFAELRRRGADLPKVAARTVTPAETHRLLAAAAASGAAPLIAIAMGGAGRLSRVAAAGVGAALGFAAQGTGSAPGQLDIRDTARIAAALAPLFQDAGEGEVN